MKLNDEDVKEYLTKNYKTTLWRHYDFLNYVEIILDWEKNRTAFIKSLKDKKNDR